MSLADLPASAASPARTVWFDGRADAESTREIPVETPVNIVYDGAPFAVMMATPQDLEDFAYGFSLTEGVIAVASDIRRVECQPQERGLALRVSLAPGISPRAVSRERNTAGRTGCGLCGIDQLDALPMAAVRTRARHHVELSAIRRGLDALEQQQALNRLTHAVHAAAWCSANGDIVAVREDVGRHNALDKLLGALLRAGHHAADGFLLITSRCSFEMVEKAAVYGASTIVAISAPTSLAVERAVLHGMTLLAVARRDSALVFHGAEFVHAGAAAVGAAGDGVT
ncbi:MAG: formate dehydrogenase accessory sulfurtransferase FdhD [Gemmatimonadaceae bacterium]|nr:formate dehydrogenase accessory sulfurtransferase FdhD [Gemmatimonadaceae bacterium]